MKKLITFAFGGFIGALINWTITYTFTEYFSIYYLLSNLVGSIVNIVFNFIYHRFITFHILNDVKVRFIRFLIVSIIIIFLNISLMYSLTKFLGLWYLFSAIIATLFIVSFNFTINKFYIFFNKHITDV